MMRTFITWYLTMQFFAWIGLPLAFVWLRKLPSRGYAVSKALGLLLTGVVLWWGGLLHLWENTTSAVLVAAGLVFAVGLWGMRQRWPEVRPWWREQRAFVFATEALFLLMLALWTMVRASQPQLETAGGEKWMEIAFLNAVLRAPHIPPSDPWLSGYAISYYYLGYFLLGMLTRLAALPATVAFNLGCAGWFALAAVGAYGIVYDLLPRRGILRPLFAPLLLLLTGNAAGFLEVLHARGLLSARFWAWLDIRNLNVAPQPPFSWKPTRFLWWWQASRVLSDYAPWGDRIEIIDEFPAFSFTLGDMHPHVLALPFVLLAIALALNLYRQLGEKACTTVGWRRFAPLAGYALVLGALGFLNTWDFPIYWALMVGGMIVALYTRATAAGRMIQPEHGEVPDADVASEPPSWRQLWQQFWATVWGVLPPAIILGVLSVVLYVPFWYALRSQAGGVLPNLFNATHWPQFVVMFAPLLVPLLGVIIGIARDARVAWRWILLGALGLMVAIALVGLIVGASAAYPYLRSVLRGEPIQGLSVTPEMVMTSLRSRWLRPWVGFVLSVGVLAVILSLLSRPRSPATPQRSANAEEQATVGEQRFAFYAFPALLVLIGLLLTLAPEFVYLKDIFVTRMNTIFKFYFQAWVVWSLAGAWQLAQWFDLGSLSTRPGEVLWRFGMTVVSCLLIAVGLVYTILAVPARAAEHGNPRTLDGAAWLATARAADYAAIQWLNTHIVGAPVIVEAPSDQYRAYVYEGRISALTGLPAVLGWAGHQLQWRGNYDEPARREQDLARLFTTLDPNEARMILARYNVAYLYLGPIEREKYPFEGLAKFASMFPVVYTGEDVTIYKVE